MNTIVVTGGAGFIGSNFILYLLKKHQDIKIINFDVLTYAGNLENLKEIEADSRYTFVKGDITDNAAVEKLFEAGVDYVVNFAAESHVDRSIVDPGVFVRTNVLGTQIMLNAASKYGVKKYLQVSTDEVYGSLGAEGFFTEETPLTPRSPYSASKAGADLLVLAYAETFGLTVNITRCSNNYGRFQFPEKAIPLFVTNALADRELPLYGDGKNVRDWLHVDDHCAAIELVLFQGVPGEVYNVGGHNEKTNIEIVETILKALHKPKSLIKFVSDRKGHDRRYAIDPAKLQRELGWKPVYTFETGIQETIEWYVNHEEWWSRIKSGEYETYYQKMYGNR